MKNIIYEDEYLIAINKEPGIVVFSELDNDLSNKVVSYFPDIKNVGGERNGAVHRLDKDTSGIVLFAKDEKTLNFLQKQFIERKTKKKYTTLVFKRVKRDEGVINASIGRSPKDRRKQRVCDNGRDAITTFKVIERFKGYTLLEAHPKTGRKHQIRCHLAYIGHPVAGDKWYGFKDQKDPQDLTRQFLHASSIEIETPKGNMVFSIELPEELIKIINKLEKDVC